MKTYFKPLLLVAALSLSGVAAIAQQGMGPGGHGGPGGRMDPQRMEQMVTKHLDALKAKLKITPAQEGAWTTFATAMKPPASMMGKHPDPAEMAKLSTPERLEKMKTLRKERHAEMDAAADKRDEAIKAFYGTLNADQKKVFDAEHARFGHHERRDNGPGQGEGKQKPAAKAPAKP